MVAKLEECIKAAVAAGDLDVNHSHVVFKDGLLITLPNPLMFHQLADANRRLHVPRTTLVEEAVRFALRGSERKGYPPLPRAQRSSATQY
jgi:hypothetical protein